MHFKTLYDDPTLQRIPMFYCNCNENTDLISYFVNIHACAVIDTKTVGSTHSQHIGFGRGLIILDILNKQLVDMHIDSLF